MTLMTPPHPLGDPAEKKWKVYSATYLNTRMGQDINHDPDPVDVVTITTLPFNNLLNIKKPVVPPVPQQNIQ